mmetsp:Transcript_42811/g.100370  ORF Transcript_42811/g.100370 Transcript_42811/m.100370 type:complete len:204 (-) Transcript_42811:1124-1735(-)
MYFLPQSNTGCAVQSAIVEKPVRISGIQVLQPYLLKEAALALQVLFELHEALVLTHRPLQQVHVMTVCHCPSPLREWILVTIFLPTVKATCPRERSQATCTRKIACCHIWWDANCVEPSIRLWRGRSTAFISTCLHQGVAQHDRHAFWTSWCAADGGLAAPCDDWQALSGVKNAQQLWHLNWANIDLLQSWRTFMLVGVLGQA